MCVRGGRHRLSIVSCGHRSRICSHLDSTPITHTPRSRRAHLPAMRIPELSSTEGQHHVTKHQRDRPVIEVEPSVWAGPSIQRHTVYPRSVNRCELPESFKELQGPNAAVRPNSPWAAAKLDYHQPTTVSVLETWGRIKNGWRDFRRGEKATWPSTRPPNPLNVR
jgi:hypothetical protein